VINKQVEGLTPSSITTSPTRPMQCCISNFLSIFTLLESLFLFPSP